MSSDLGKATHLDSGKAPSGSNGSMIQVSLLFIPSLLLQFLSSFFFFFLLTVPFSPVLTTQSVQHRLLHNPCTSVQGCPALEGRGRMDWEFGVSR